MTRSRAVLSTLSASLLVVTMTSLPALAAPPGEVQQVAFGDSATLGWDPTAGADVYHVYRGVLSGMGGSDAARCHAFDLTSNSLSTPAAPEPGQGYFYLVTAESDSDGEGTPGLDSAAVPRPLLGSCRPVMRFHVFNRLGFGWSEWSRDRLATLGLEGYITEQIAAGTIDDASNPELLTRLAVLEPPTTLTPLIAAQVVRAVYSRRQLEQQVALFWANHFNTYWGKLNDIFRGVYPNCNTGLPQCDPAFPTQANLESSLAQQLEIDNFRNLAFKGNFRQILEASALGPAMILFLDTYANIATAPNENYARELLELYSMGVDGGYTQQDVEELARVLTGWTLCRKKLNALSNPLIGCIEPYYADVEGKWRAHFFTPNHDCGAKVLFQGTPQETTIPATCGTPDDGVQDIQLALDAIAAHPSTARFISRKLLERFVTEEPDESLIDDLVAVWDDPTNTWGVGDLPAVLGTALTHPAFLDPDRVRTKIKTPLEHYVSSIRGTRGHTDGIDFVLEYLFRAQHIPFYNPVPTGWPEDGDHWLDTTNMLERQNFGLYLTAFNNTEFGSDPISLLNDNGVSTAAGNSAAIVDFFVEVLLGGAASPVQRQAAIDFLDTDINGIPSPYDDTRIRRTVGFLLGYPEFQEQ